MSFAPSDSALGEFYAESEEILVRVSQALSKMEAGAYTQEDVDSLYRDIHTLKGSAQLFGFQSIGVVAHAIEASLEPVRKKKKQVSSLELMSRVTFGWIKEKLILEV